MPRAKAGRIHVEGLTELLGRMKELSETAEGPKLQAALLEAAQQVRAEAARRAPIAPAPYFSWGSPTQPGGLRKSLRAASGRQHKTFLQAFTFVLTDDAPYAAMVHNGTKPHAIEPGRGKKMRIAARAFAWLSRVGDQVRTKVFHPGSRPIPFMSDAVKAKRTAVKRMLERRVKAAFDALARAS